MVDISKKRLGKIGREGIEESPRTPEDERGGTAKSAYFRKSSKCCEVEKMKTRKKRRAPTPNGSHFNYHRLKTTKSEVRSRGNASGERYSMWRIKTIGEPSDVVLGLRN